MQPFPKSLRAGFTLVEVTLSVAIASLAIITLLGLLPQGLEMSRKTGLLTSNSNILEQIIRDLENAQWTFIKTDKTRKYYNDQGGEVKSDSKEIIFVAEIDLQQPAALPKAETTQNYLRRVIVRVANTANKNFVFGENNRSSYATFNHMVAKTR